MSWGVSSAGATSAVAKEIDGQLDRIITNKYVTDTAELRQVADVRALIAGALADFTGTTGVQVSANGSLSTTGADIKNYSIEISIKPFWNWVS